MRLGQGLLCVSWYAKLVCLPRTRNTTKTRCMRRAPASPAWSLLTLLTQRERVWRHCGGVVGEPYLVGSDRLLYQSGFESFPSHKEPFVGVDSWSMRCARYVVVAAKITCWTGIMLPPELLDGCHLPR
ncbi:hypothetical protein F5B21DRAFT_307508 [Xylaria acuta]|nr:hypothetical protein F5B21DRAFT_307508 [Xylaria acuta]